MALLNTSIVSTFACAKQNKGRRNNTISIFFTGIGYLGSKANKIRIILKISDQTGAKNKKDLPVS
tara:strand:+ start:114762 stop:114956 length:195 start_codon:yes stop_codon:yes gene_type:complete